MIGRNSTIYFNMDLKEIHFQFFFNETAVIIETKHERNGPQLFPYQNYVRHPYRQTRWQPQSKLVEHGDQSEIHLKLLSKLKPSLMWKLIIKLISH